MVKILLQSVCGRTQKTQSSGVCAVTKSRIQDLYGQQQKQTLRSFLSSLFLHFLFTTTCINSPFSYLHKHFNVGRKIKVGAKRLVLYHHVASCLKPKRSPELPQVTHFLNKMSRCHSWTSLTRATTFHLAASQPTLLLSLSAREPVLQPTKQERV